MATNKKKKFNVSETDFFAIKDNLKDFLRGKSEFADYDFEGSTLNSLLDLFAYNTHYLSVYGNLAFNETFLDTARQRNALVSRSKELNYLPKSKSAAYFIVDVTFSATGNPAFYTIPKRTRFETTEDGATYIFQNLHDCSIERDNDNLYRKRIQLVQGQFTSFSYDVETSATDQNIRYLIPSNNVDTRYMTVTVYDNESDDEGTIYEYYKDLNDDLTGDSEVYFLQESYDGYYEVYFGDNIIGNAPEAGNIVEIEYFVTRGEEANGLSNISLTSSLSGVSNLNISVIQESTGGSAKESLNSIRFNAPLRNQAQDRGVIRSDYTSIIRSEFKTINDVTVWGGEENDPPYYGRVFAAVRPKAGFYISATEKQRIQNQLINNHSIVGIIPEIVDASYIEVSMEIVIVYDESQLSSSTDLESVVSNAVENFFEDNVDRFRQPLYYSKLVKEIEDSSDVILNCVVNLYLERNAEIFEGGASTYEFNFNNAIHPGSISSNEFFIDGNKYSLLDIPGGPGPHDVGRIAVYREVGGSREYYSRNAGTIDYNDGSIRLEDFRIDSIVDNPVERRLFVKVAPGAFANVENPEIVYTDYNVYTNERDQIITLKDGGVDITLISDRSEEARRRG